MCCRCLSRNYTSNRDIQRRVPGLAKRRHCAMVLVPNRPVPELGSDSRATDRFAAPQPRRETLLPAILAVVQNGIFE